MQTKFEGFCSRGSVHHAVDVGVAVLAGVMAKRYEAVLGQMVTLRERGTTHRVTAAEAFLHQLTKRGLEGDGAGVPCPHPKPTGKE